MRYVLSSEVVEFNRLTTRDHGGVHSIIDRHKLESALGAVEQSFGGEVLLATLEAAASGCWYYICQAHAFLDGNKRASLIVTEYFLELNGYELDLSQAEAEHITLEIAKGAMTRKQVEALIRIKPLGS